MKSDSPTHYHRLVLANKPRLLREMLRRVLAKIPDLEIAGEVINLPELLWLVEHAKPHWVIITLTDEDNIPPPVKSLLNRYPTLYILAIAPDGSQVKVNQVGFQEDFVLDNLSLDELIALLRSK